MTTLVQDMAVSHTGAGMQSSALSEPVASVAAVRWAVFRMWPPDNPAFSIRRELALLLLDDPDLRLRISHAELLLTTKPNCSNGGFCLQKALCEPDCSPFFVVDYASKTEWSSKVVKLNTQEILKQTQQRLEKPAPALSVQNDADLASAIASAWSEWQTDDDDYFAVVIAWIVATKMDTKAQLPQYSLHMTDVGGYLRAMANTDERLSTIFPRAHHVRVGKPRPRLSEFLTQPRYSAYFALYDSTVRKSEKVVVLLVDELLADLPEHDSQTLPHAGTLPFPASASGTEQLPQFLFEFEQLDPAFDIGSGPTSASPAGSLFSLRSPGFQGATAALQLDPIVDTPAPPSAGLETSSTSTSAAQPTPCPTASQVCPDATGASSASRGSTFLQGIASPLISASQPLPPVPVTPSVSIPEDPFGHSGWHTAVSSSRDGSLSSSFAHVFMDGHQSFFGAPLFCPSVAQVPDSIASCWSMDTKLDSVSSFAQSPGAGLISARLQHATLELAGRESSSTSAGSSATDAALDQHAAAAEQLLLSSDEICMPGWSISADDDTLHHSIAWDEESAGESCVDNPLHDRQLTSDLKGHGCDQLVPIGKLGAGTASQGDASFAPCTPGMLATSPVTATPLISQENSSSTDADTEDSLFHFTVGDSDDSPVTGTTPCMGTTPTPALTGYAAVAARKPVASGALGSPIPLASSSLPTKPPSAWAAAATSAAPAMLPAVTKAAATSWASTVATGKPAAGKVAAEEGDGGKAKSACPGPSAQDLARAFPKLSTKVRKEITALVQTCSNVKLEDFDDGVVFQLIQRGEDEAAAALRSISTHDLTNIQHMAAFINFVIKNSHQSPSGVSSLPPGMQGGSCGGLLRSNAAPVSSKAIFQKLPIKVYRRLESVIANCRFLEWKHFDAGVIKVLSQLARIAEDDVLVELDTLQHSDLSSVEYMPAYLNKRLNNRLWLRRKAPDGSSSV